MATYGSSPPQAIRPNRSNGRRPWGPCSQHPAGQEVELYISNGDENVVRRKADIALQMHNPTQVGIIITAPMIFESKLDYAVRAGKENNPFVGIRRNVMTPVHLYRAQDAGLACPR